MKAKLKNFITTLLIISLILPLPIQTNADIISGQKNNNINNNINIDKLHKKDGIYDILIKCKIDDENAKNNLSLKEIANISQKDIINFLQKNKDVDFYESFYIVNGIHAIIRNKKVIEDLIKFPNVKDITNNGKIYKIEPIKNKRKKRSIIFAPDEKEIEWGVSAVHADKVWEDFKIKGEDVTVGIIDTGVNYKLPALKHAYKGYDENTGNFDPKYYKDCVDGFSEPSENSENDHGTHVTGSICGVEGENINQIGVAPNIKFISAKALNNQGGETSNLLEAAEFMLEQKPDIINNSWGGSADNDDWFYEIAQKWKDAGIMAIFAAGNAAPSEGEVKPGSLANPGNMLNVFSVGACDINKKIGPFSKKGPSAFDDTKSIIKPDVVAPGVQVRSIDAKGTYVSWNGTSMATPHVTGVAALIKSANKNLSVDQISNIIRETAQPLTDEKNDTSPNMTYGYGLINAYDAVAKAKNREMGLISGHIFKEGKDTQKASIQMISQNIAYVGRDFNILAKISDDVSIKEAKASYNVNGIDKTLKMQIISGNEKEGTYKATIKAEELKTGSLDIKIEALDFANNNTTENVTITINAGITLPYKCDFENATDGFIFEGRWRVSQKLSPAEPDMVDNGIKYVGIDAGKPTFDKQIDSYLYLPPINLTNINTAFLSLDEYHGFTGLSTAQIQASRDGKNWSTIHNISIRPDYTLDTRKWEHLSYDLSSFANSENLLVRFYFHGTLMDKNGCGWYIDNIKIEGKDTTAPPKIEYLTGDILGNSLKISFKGFTDTELPDLKSYKIERKLEGSSDFTTLVEIQKNDIEKVFVPKKGSIPSYWKCSHIDNTIENNKIYIYRVMAIDASDNISPPSNELKVEVPATFPQIYNFDNDDGGFTVETLNSDPTDWQWGLPIIPNPIPNDINNRNCYEGLLRGKKDKSLLTNMWGTKLDGKCSDNQDTCLLMPEFTVNKNDTINFDSFCAFNPIAINAGNTCSVEIKEKDKNDWEELVGAFQIHSSQFDWHTFSRSLTKYEGKIVNIRFHFKTSSGWKDNYDIGWYIDNVMIGKESHFSTLNIDNSGFVLSGISSSTSNNITPSAMIMGGTSTLPSASSPSIIPLRAKITILETGSYTYADVKDGSFSIKHSINEENKPYHVMISAYGFEPQIFEANLFNAANHKIEKDITLKVAKKVNIKGKVLDEKSKPLKDATIKILNDNENSTTISSDNGEFTFDNIFTGRYKIRGYKDGYVSKEINIDVKGNDSFELQLNKITNKNNSLIDYGFNIKKDPEKGYQTTHFIGSMKGCAVKFQSPKIGGMLKDVDVFLVNNQIYSGSHIQIAVLGYDEHGRLRELIPFFEVTNIKPNEWNKIDLTEYSLFTDKSIYVATRYEKELNESAGVYYDITSKKGIEKSFIYDGSFIKTSIMPAKGAYAIKSTWACDNDAKENPEDTTDNSSSDSSNAGTIKEGDEVFIFDKSTNTITGYNGKNTDITIPSKIDNVPVKKIAPNAFDATNTGTIRKVKLRSIILEDGIEEIGKEAFKNNNLSQITLPSSIKNVDEGAFKGQYKDGIEDKTLNVNILGKVEQIKSNVFESSGNPVIVNAPNVTEIKKDAFLGNKNVEITAPILSKIEDGTFGKPTKLDEFNYAKIYTNINTTLSSKDGEYLINPALITINMIDARDHENTLKIGLLYGRKPNPTSYKRDIKADRYYKIGEKVEIKAPNITDKNNISYISYDKEEIILEKENILNFYYYKESPEIRLPLLEKDMKIVGFTSPLTQLKIKVDNEDYNIKSDDDGFFELNLKKALEKNNTVSFLLEQTNKEIFKTTVQKKPTDKFIARDDILLRYIGNEKNVTIPNAIGGGKNLTQISPFAFYNKKIDKVTLPQSIISIGVAAFMDCDLSEFNFTTKNINLSALRTIKEWAFKNNNLTSVELPELTHIIQKRAFEHNKIKILNLGKYTGHIGDYAFYDNKIEDLTIYGNTEELGVAAFMKNNIKSLKIMPKSASAHDALEEISELTFADNYLNDVTMPDNVANIHATAFNGNLLKNVLVRTNNENVKPGEHFDILRDGKLFTLNNNGGTTPSTPSTPSNNNPSSSYGGGSSSGGSSFSNEKILEKEQKNDINKKNNKISSENTKKAYSIKKLKNKNIKIKLPRRLKKLFTKIIYDIKVDSNKQMIIVRLPYKKKTKKYIFKIFNVYTGEIYKAKYDKKKKQLIFKIKYSGRYAILKEKTK